MEELKNLNDLHRCGKLGIFKQYIYTQNADIHKVCDILESIKNNIEDINDSIHDGVKTRKDFLYIIASVDGIVGAYSVIKKAIVVNALSDYDDEYLQTYTSFFKALRSFALAHPLETCRHKNYGLDGSYICVDVWNKNAPVLQMHKEFNSTHFEWIDKEGKHKGMSDKDFYMHVYSIDDSMKFSSFIGVNVTDIVDVARVYIDAIYKLDKHLIKIRKANL